MSQTGERKPFSLLLQQLSERAEQKGWLTQEDILEIYPSAASDPGKLSRVIAALRLHGIEILSQEEAADPKGELAFEDHDALLAIEYVSSDDTVSLYLKEMAVTPLLSLEQEVGLAKRIARGWQAKRELGRPNGNEPELRREMDAIVQDEQAIGRFIKTRSRTDVRSFQFQ